MTWRLASALLSFSFLPSIHAKPTFSSFSLFFIFSYFRYLIFCPPALILRSSILFITSFIFYHAAISQIKIYIFPARSKNIFGTFRCVYFLNRVTPCPSLPFLLHHLRNSSSNIFVTPFNPFKLFAAEPVSRRTSFQARSTVSFPVSSCSFSFPWLFIPERDPFLTIISLFSPCTLLSSTFLSHSFGISLVYASLRLFPGSVRYQSSNPAPSSYPARSSTASVSGWRGCWWEGEE